VKASTPSFLMEGRRRKAELPGEAPARFGFTVTKKLGNAVRRNRIRRRLKAAIAAGAGGLAQSGFDYVIVARSAAFDRPYSDLVADVSRALTALHAPRPAKSAKTDSSAPHGG
jgi:ribonuclease P protein component